jgi:hypothetical protein
MQQVKIDNWKWQIEDTALLHGWFEHWEDIAGKNTVKENPIRIVFKVDDLFYVKLERATGFWHKIRSTLHPKAAREFAVGQALEAADVPVVKHLGWARNGSANMLLTEAMPDSRSVLEYWYSEIIYGFLEPNKFLAGFSKFLKTFFTSGFYHPDFHIGNILYSPATENFALVDVYGISFAGKLSPRQIAAHNRIFLELRRGLSDSEAVDFITRTCNNLTSEKARDFWQDGLKNRVAKIQKDWTKRQTQIRNNYAKFIEVVKTPENEFLVRKHPGPVPSIKLTNIPDCLNGNNFDIIRLSQDEAEELWLESFHWELLGIDHLRPLVFEKPGVLYFEKAPHDAHTPSPEKTEEFVKRAKTAGIEINSETLQQFPGGRITTALDTSL